MTTPSKLNELNHAEEPARLLLQRLGWTYVPRESMAQERGDEGDVLLKGRLRRALLLLNEWMTGTQADRAIFELKHINATGMARNQRVHQYLTFGLPLTVDGPRGRVTRNVRFFDFDHPVGRSQRIRGHHPVQGVQGQRAGVIWTTTNGWSFPTWRSSSTASPWWSWRPSRRHCWTCGSPGRYASCAATRKLGRSGPAPVLLSCSITT